MTTIVEILEFHPFRLDIGGRRLLREGAEVSLTPKAFEALTMLIRHRGEVVRKQELLDAVWRDTNVEEAVLTQNIYTLRKTLGDRGPGYRMIATVPRIGYRFIAPVREIGHAADDKTPVRCSTIAVLPFETLGGNESLRVLGIGMADALITRLSGIRSLTVRPTSAVLRLGRDVALDPVRAGKVLGVEAVLEGRLQVASGRARVTVQLVGLASEGTIWGGRFEEPAHDLFAVQDAIAEKLAESLRLELTPQERDSLGPGTASGDAYNAYIRGRYFWSQRTGESLGRAIELFRQAAESDPSWALPHVGLADCHVVLPFYADAAAGESFRAARRAAEAALAIEPDLAEAITVLAYTKFVHDREWEEAEADFWRAIDRRPGYDTAHHWYSFLLAARSRSEEAVIHASRAIDLDPLSLVNNADLGWVQYFGRQYADAAERFRATVELDDRFGYAHVGLALTLLQLRQVKGAVAEARRGVETSARGSVAQATLVHVLGRAGRGEDARRELAVLVEDENVPASRLALALPGIGEIDAALDALERACEQRSRFAAFLAVWPVFDSLRAHPRFQTLLDLVGLRRGA